MKTLITNKNEITLALILLAISCFVCGLIVGGLK